MHLSETPQTMLDKPYGIKLNFNKELSMSGLLILAIAAIGAPLIIRLLLEVEKWTHKPVAQETHK